MLNHTYARTTMLVTAGALTIGLFTGCATHPGTDTGTSATPTDYASAQAETYASAQAKTYASAQAEADAQAAAEDLSTMIDYRSVISDLQSLLADAEDYVDDGDAAGLKSLGNDFVRLARRGHDLADIPDASEEANDAWESAMDQYQVMGGALQVGLYAMAGDAMDTASEHIKTATAELNAG